MPLFLLLPVLIGVASVIQAGMNRQIGARWGLASSVLISSGVLFVAAIVLWTVSRLSPGRLPPFFEAPPGPLKPFVPWVLFPGLLGMVVVAGMPWAIQRVGAAVTLVLIIAAQMVLGLAWDIKIEGQPFSWLKLAGATLAIGGAAVTAWAR